MKRLYTIILMALILTGCNQYVISQDIRSEATNVPYNTARQDVNRYKGQMFIWGGFVAEINASENRTTMEVVENPTNKFGEIVDSDISEGRFIVEFNKRLDPLIFKKNRQITVAGRLIGSETKTLGGADYLYPVLEGVEIYLWKQERQYYYSPYYYPAYYFDPFYYDPFFRHRYFYPWWY